MTKQIRIYLFLFLATLLAGLPAYGKVGSGTITMTTAKKVGEAVYLEVMADGEFTIEGAKEYSDAYRYYIITDQRIVIRGNVTELKCGSDFWGDSELTTLNVSGCTTLKTLDCSKNKLTNLNVSGCTELTKLDCRENQLTALDVSGCTELTELKCYNNRIKGEAMTRLVSSLPDRTGKWERGCLFIRQLCESGSNLCLESDAAIAKAKKWYTKDSNGNYYNGFGSNVIIFTTAKNVGETIDLNLSTLYCYDIYIEGVEKATSICGKSSYTLTAQQVTIYGDLKELGCEGNQLTALDMSGCTALTSLDCSNNQLSSLDVSKNTELTKLDCTQNQLTALDISKNTELTELYCSENQLAELDVSQNIALTRLRCYQNQLTALEVSQNTALTLLNCWGNQLTALDISKNTSLTELYCSDNQLTALDISGCTALAKLRCSTNQLASLDVSRNNLWWLDCSYNQLTALDVSSRTALEALYCGGNKLTMLDLSKNAALTRLWCYQNQLTGLNVSNNTLLTELYCFGNQIKGEEMARLVNCLPDLTGRGAGQFVVMQEPLPEGNECFKADVTIAKEKNWKTLQVNLATDPWGKSTYEGLDARPFVVTFTKEGEGTLSATGANNLRKVEYGTELTIVAIPADGYTLEALTANGEDILATRKFIVTAATEVKATFSNVKKTFSVTLTKKGEGVLRSTGADNLNEVAYGTELTIVATPADGYTLEALTANGADILATKKFVVTGATEVKATFAKQRFNVTLTKEGKGMLDATGAADLTAVPYGTELTIVATPALKYELVALTANGADILATKKIVVTENTEVKATFANKTAADSVEAGSVRLYPNPASTYVNVKAANADALVRLYDANGTLLYEARTDDHGILQIELSAYAEGTYLLLVGDDAQRLLIQR